MIALCASAKISAAEMEYAILKLKSVNAILDLLKRIVH